MIKKFLSDLIKYLPGKIAPAIIGFISIPIITRYFPPDVYGNYSFVLSIVSFMTITVGWIGMSNLRYYPQYEQEGKLKEYSSIVFKIAVISIVIAASIYLIILLAFRNRIPDGLFSLYLISVLYFVVFTFFTISQNFLRVNDHVGLFSTSTIWKNLTGVSLALLFIIVFGLGIEAMFIGTIISILLILPYTYKKSFAKVSFKVPVESELVKKFFFYSYPLVLGNAFSFLIKFSDRLFIPYFESMQELGIYSANYYIADHSIMLITSLFLYAAHPMSIKIWETEGKEKTKKFLEDSTALYIILALPATFGVSILAKDMISVLLDSEYHEGYFIIPYVSFGIFLFGLQHRYQSGLHFSNKTIYITYAIIIAGIVNISLNLILIPYLGYIGAAVSTLVSYTSMFISMYLYSRRILKFSFPITIFLKCLLATVFMSLIIITASYYSLFKVLMDSEILLLILKVGVGIFIYITALFLMGIKNNFKEFNVL